MDKYFYHPERRLDQPLLQDLKRLHNRGLPVGILTNSVLEWEQHRRRMLGSVDFIDHYLRSHEVGLAKLEPAIFELADCLLGTPASQKISHRRPGTKLRSSRRPGLAAHPPHKHR